MRARHAPKVSPPARYGIRSTSRSSTGTVGSSCLLRPEHPGQREERVVVQDERAVVALAAHHELPLGRGHHVDQVRVEQPAHRGLRRHAEAAGQDQVQHRDARLDLRGGPQLDLVTRLPDQRETAAGGSGRPQPGQLVEARLADRPGIGRGYGHVSFPVCSRGDTAGRSPWPGRIAPFDRHQRADPRRSTGRRCRLQPIRSMTSGDGRRAVDDPDRTGGLRGAPGAGRSSARSS